MNEPTPVNFTVGNTSMTGTLPSSYRVLSLLIRERYVAFGYEEGERVHEVDVEHLGAVYHTALVLCYPALPSESKRPTLQEYRHDIIAMGDASFTWLVTNGLNPGPMGSAAAQMLDAMLDAFTAISEKVKANQVFSPAQTEISTTTSS